jgi:hypothetical protein
VLALLLLLWGVAVGEAQWQCVGIRVGVKIAAVAVQLRVHVAGVGGCKQPR